MFLGAYRPWNKHMERPMKALTKPGPKTNGLKKTLTLYFGPADMDVFIAFKEFMVTKNEPMSTQIVDWIREGLERENN